jgi:DNA-binding transcriptional LysR family regulator
MTGVNSSSFEVKNLSTMAGLIRHGLRVSLLPALTLFQFQHPDLVTIKLAPPGINRSIQIIRHKDKPRSIAAQAMMELVREKKPG